MGTRQFLHCCMLAALTVGISASIAGAAETEVRRQQVGVEPDAPQIGLSPPQLTRDYQPGTSYRAEVILRNTTADGFTVKVDVFDLKAADDPDSLVLPDRRSSGASNWFTPAVKTTKIAAGEKIFIPITIDVPSGARPGLHAVGVSLTRALTQPTTNTERTTRVTVNGSLTAEFFLRVAGPATTKYSLDVERAPRWVRAGEHPVYSVLVHNTGATLLETSGTLALGSFAGTNAGSYKLDPTKALVLPDGKRRLRARWTDPPFIGWFKPAAFVDVNGKRETVRMQAVFVLPPWWLIVALIAAILLPVVARKRRRRTRREK